MNTKYIGTLDNSLLFHGIEKEHIKTMLHCLNPRISKYKRHDFITMAGDDFKELGILLEGEALVSKENAAGNRVMMMQLKPGQMFGEMVVFSSLKVWPVTVQAQSDCTVFFLSEKKIIGECERVCTWHKELIQNMLRITSERALMLNKKVEYLSMKSMRGKLSSYLLEQYHQAQSGTFDLPLNRNELADFLNVSRPSMSREMGRMRDEGIIDYYKSSIKIKDIVALRSMAE